MYYNPPAGVAGDVSGMDGRSGGGNYPPVRDGADWPRGPNLPSSGGDRYPQYHRDNEGHGRLGPAMVLGPNQVSLPPGGVSGPLYQHSDGMYPTFRGGVVCVGAPGGGGGPPPPGAREPPPGNLMASSPAMPGGGVGLPGDAIQSGGPGSSPASSIAARPPRSAGPPVAGNMGAAVHPGMASNAQRSTSPIVRTAKTPAAAAAVISGAGDGDPVGVHPGYGGHGGKAAIRFRELVASWFRGPSRVCCGTRLG